MRALSNELWTWPLGVAVLVAVLTLMTVVAVVKTPKYRERRFLEERAGFERLARLAADMAAESRSDGADSRSAFVASFDAFYTFVSKLHPDLVSSRDGLNPFPGILPSGEYRHLMGSAQGGSVPLIWSVKVYRIGGENRQWCLTCDGVLKNSADDFGYRPGP